MPKPSTRASSPASSPRSLSRWQPPAGPPLVLIEVPAGPFTMGYEDSSDERPVHEHRIDRPYFIARDPITWAHYLAFCEATGHARPEVPAWGIAMDHPVVGVSFDDALAYCTWAGVTLPSEPQWEKAARGTEGALYPWGDEEPTDFGPNDLCVTWSHPIWGTRARHSTAPVEACAQDVSPYGARHMVGNVNEWVADRYDARAYDRYVQGDFAPPEERDDEPRVLRGSNYQGPARFARASCRITANRDTRSNAIGFRIALRADIARTDPRWSESDDAATVASARLDLRPLARAAEANDEERFADAVGLAWAAIAAVPDGDGGYRELVRALRGNGERAAAAAALRLLASRFPANGDLQCSTGAELHELGWSSSAADLLGPIVPLRSDEPKIALNHIIALLTAGRHLETVRAVSILRESLPIPVLSLLQAIARFELGDTAGALDDLDAYLRDSDDDSAAHNIRGDMLMESGRDDEARAAYERALTLVDAQLSESPEDETALARRAYSLLALGRPEEAEAIARAVVRTHPDETLAWRSVGRAALELGRPIEALEALQRAHALAPDRIDVDYDRARALAASGERIAATFVLGRVAASSPRLAKAAARDRWLADLDRGPQ